MQKYLFLRNFSLDFPLEALVQGLGMKLKNFGIIAPIQLAVH